MTFNPEAELKFAACLYVKACEGLSGDEVPPTPLEFLKCAESLIADWEKEKEAVRDDPEFDEEIFRSFLSCATARYLDFMSEIYKRCLLLDDKGKEDIEPIPVENSSNSEDQELESSNEDVDEVEHNVRNMLRESINGV